MEVEMVTDINININIDLNIAINMEIQFGERVGHRDWLIGPKLFFTQIPGLRKAHLLSFASLFLKQASLSHSCLTAINTQYRRLPAPPF